MSTISCFILAADAGGQIEDGIIKSLWERHIGHVLLVFLSSFSDFGFAGAEARQFRTHSGERGGYVRNAIDCWGQE